MLAAAAAAMLAAFCVHVAAAMGTQPRTCTHANVGMQVTDVRVSPHPSPCKRLPKPRLGSHHTQLPVHGLSNIGWCLVQAHTHTHQYMSTRSRSYGVQKDHATAVAACTYKTHETMQVVKTQWSCSRPKPLRRTPSARSRSRNGCPSGCL